MLGCLSGVLMMTIATERATASYNRRLISITSAFLTVNSPSVWLRSSASHRICFREICFELVWSLLCRVEQQKEMAAVIEQWRETIAQAHQNAEPGLILKRCCQCHRRTGAMITICLLRLLRTSQKGTKSNISVGVWCCCLGEVRTEYWMRRLRAAFHRKLISIFIVFPDAFS